MLFKQLIDEMLLMGSILECSGTVLVLQYGRSVRKPEDTFKLYEPTTNASRHIDVLACGLDSLAAMNSSYMPPRSHLARPQSLASYLHVSACSNLWYAEQQRNCELSVICTVLLALRLQR